MLKGISPALVPDLLKILAEMGHGDEIVIGDGNFPSASMGKRNVRCDGHSATEILDGILDLLPLDNFVEAPVALMKVVPGTFDGDPPIWDEFRKIVDKHQDNVKIEFEERFDFYERSKKAFATVQTGEKAIYACVILKKGIM